MALCWWPLWHQLQAGAGRCTLTVIHFHVSKLVLAGATPGLRAMILVGLFKASCTSSHYDVWSPRGRVPRGKCMTFLYLSSEITEGHFLWTLLVPVVTKTHLVSEQGNTLSISWWGRFAEELRVERYHCSHLCKTQFAPLTSFHSLSPHQSVFSIAYQKEIWSCHSLVQQQGRLFSALHPTKSGLFCGAASLREMKGM